MRYLFKFVLLLLFSTSLAANSASQWYSQQSDKSVILNVSLFLSSTCTHCHKTDAFFKEIESSTPWLKVQRYVIDKDKNALIHFNQLLLMQKNQDFAVPSIFFCNSRWVGFNSAKTTGQELLRGMNYCKKQLEKKNELKPATVEVLNRWANADLFTSSMLDEPSNVSYIVMMAFMDAINPCAMFGLICFLGVLFIQKQRRFIVCSGILYIVAVACVHYVQQVHPDTFFVMLAWLRLPALLTGLLLLYVGYYCFYQKKYHSLIWPMVFLLALFIQAYQQTCIMNWSYIFQQWLLNQQNNPLTHALYQLAYQLIYLSFFGLILAGYLFYRARKSFNRQQALLQIIGLFFIGSSSIVLVIYPYALSYLMCSWLVLLGSVLCGWIINKSISSKAKA